MPPVRTCASPVRALMRSFDGCSHYPRVRVTRAEYPNAIVILPLTTTVISSVPHLPHSQRLRQNNSTLMFHGFGLTILAAPKRHMSYWGRPRPFQEISGCPLRTLFSHTIAPDASTTQDVERLRQELDRYRQEQEQLRQKKARVLVMEERQKGLHWEDEVRTSL